MQGPGKELSYEDRRSLERRDRKEGLHWIA
jgi:hypothetical protein